MANNITLLYYTANRIHESFAKKVREHLIESANGKPIISVSQKPIDFGENICVDLEPSRESLCKQILIGAKAVKTEYVACCEDDTLYVTDHFNYTIPKDAFSYNVNHWHLCRDVYFFRGHRTMLACVAPTELMVKIFEATVNGTEIPWVKRLRFVTETPPITFRHRYSLDGIPRIPNRYKQAYELPYWGNAEELWEEFYGE